MEEKEKRQSKTIGDDAVDQKKPGKNSDADKDVAQSRSGSTSKEKAKPDAGKPERPKIKNSLREIRIERMMSKAELARKAGLSVLTVARIEKGYGCRMDTKRKILKALGLKLSDRRQVFEDE
jgi:DNA-binding XRE family transcriptional regulator